MKITEATKNRLARLYENWVGYNPFDDCPTITAAEVLAILRDYRDEYATGGK